MYLHYTKFYDTMYLTTLKEDKKMIEFILDSDVGSDADDIMALAYLANMQKKGVLTVKAVAHSQTAKHGPALIRSFFRTAGLPVPEVGTMVGGTPFTDYYCEKTCEKFATEEDYAPCDTAVRVLRRALATSEKAVLCAIGPLTNIGALFVSEGDDISPLNGADLVKEKCEKMILMAGCFVTDEKGERMPEFNVKLDAPASINAVKNCPVPIVFLPFETGLNIDSGKAITDKYGESNILAKVFTEYPHKHGGNNHSWDPATAIYAIEGCREFFRESEKGAVTVDEIGRTFFAPDANGKHVYLTMNVPCGKSEKEIKDACGKYLDDTAIELYERLI